MTWPTLDHSAWAPTGKSLHMWAQIVGKFRLAQTPWVNHSWHATLYPNARGLTTGLLLGGFEVRFDFRAHRLEVISAEGAQTGFDLAPMPVAAFDAAFQVALERVGAPQAYHHFPNEVPDPVPFAQQTEPGAYDPAAAQAWWLAMTRMVPVFETFRTGFLGKVSPVHLFWGSFDVAVTRFSGRRAPLHPGGFPALPDTVTQEAYSHEVSSAGFWGGDAETPAFFYAYAYPTPDGFAARDPGAKGAYFDKDLGEYVLPYDVVARAEAPERLLLQFLEATYAAAADLADWDRAALDCAYGEICVPRPL
ncbi:MAG: DUF5996 family protein [Pseudomonadota bacterium]